MLKLTPRKAPILESGSVRMTVITWNCTKSDHPRKLEQIAELVWGPANREEFADLVLIQEFSQNMSKYPADFAQLCQAFTDNGWDWLKTPNQGSKSAGQSAPTGSGCYFLVWNAGRLDSKKNWTFIEDVTAPQVVPVYFTASSRPSKKGDQYDPARLAEENNPPLALELTSSIRPDQSGRLPVSLYTVHISPKGADARIPDLDQDPIVPFLRSDVLENFRKLARMVQDASNAQGRGCLFILAGDLNVAPGVVTEYFPVGEGFRTASGGGPKQLDHIVACFGGSLQITRFDPPVSLKPGKAADQIGDHLPLGARLQLQ